MTTTAKHNQQNARRRVLKLNPQQRAERQASKAPARAPGRFLYVLEYRRRGDHFTALRQKLRVDANTIAGAVAQLPPGAHGLKVHEEGPNPAAERE